MGEAIFSAVFTRDGCSGSMHELLTGAWGLRRLGEARRRGMLQGDAAAEECYSGRDAEAEWMQEYGGCWVMGGSVG